MEKTKETHPFVSEIFLLFKVLCVAKNKSRIKKEKINVDGETDYIGSSSFSDKNQEYKISVIATKFNGSWQAFSAEIFDGTETKNHRFKLNDYFFEKYPGHYKNITSALDHYFK